MPSISSVFGGSRSSAPAKSSVTRTQSLTAAAEPQQLEDAMRGVAYIMHDDLEAAEKALESDSSAFHKLGLGVIWFMRATMGYEADIMRNATERLAIAESTANEQKRRAQRDPDAHTSAIYPLGTEYALTTAEAQIMSAVISLTTESLTDALKGFYKARKALTALEAIADVEKVYIKQKGISRVDSPTSDGTNGSLDKSAPSGVEVHGNDKELFADAEEATDDSSQNDKYLGHMESSGILHDLSDLSHAPPPPASAKLGSSADGLIPASEIKTSLDIFVHTGYCLFHGMLLLMLSLVPPTFNKILSIIGFRGDRDRGLDMLWHAAGFPGVNGAMAGLVVIGFYSGSISSLEIVPADSIPRDDWRALVTQMRKDYPKSRLILVEEARMLLTERRLDDAATLLNSGEPGPIKQIEAMKWFEIALISLLLHRYEVCAEAFLKCIEMNSWSHALYYYIAAACHIELYRTYKYGELPEDDSNGVSNGKPATREGKAKHHAAKATELLDKVPQHLSKKRMFSRPPPFDALVSRKLAKWNARAKQRNIPLIDAVGISPVEELIYFWAGYKRMQPEPLHDSLQRLRFSDGGAGEDPDVGSSSTANGHSDSQQPAAVACTWKPETSSSWAQEPDDEKASLALLRATIYRNLGHTQAAGKLLDSEIIDKHNRATFKSTGGGSGREGDLWALPCARYEAAACAWMERERLRREGGGDAATEKRLLSECGANLEQVANWENFDLDTRIGMRIAAGRETVRALSAGSS